MPELFMRVKTCAFALAALTGAVVSAPAWAADCSAVAQEVAALLENAPAALSDQDYVRAEDLYGQGKNICDAGENDQALVLLDEAKFLLGG